MLRVNAEGSGKVVHSGPKRYHEGGASLVIDADPDDYKADPAGNSGVRISCGVIEK
jgi:Cu/Zn superoxide dismutase